MRASWLGLGARRWAHSSAAVSAPPPTRIGFVGMGGRANAVVFRMSARSSEAARPAYSFALVTDDARTGGGREVNTCCVQGQLDETAQEDQVTSLLSEPGSELAQAVALGGPESGPHVAFVVADLSESLSSGGAAVVARHLRAADAERAVLGVALLPFSFGGALLAERARAGLQALKKECDAVIVLDSSALRQESLQAAAFYDLHETWLDMCAANLLSLAEPLVRRDGVLRVSLASFRRLFAAERGRGREARLVRAQLQGEGHGEGSRGKTVLRHALTNEFFPLNDVSQAYGVLVTVEASKDLTYQEIEQIFDMGSYLPDKALVVQGLSYSQSPGLQVTLAVVGGTAESPEDLEHDRLEQLKQREQMSRDGRYLWWKRFKDWL